MENTYGAVNRSHKGALVLLKESIRFTGSTVCLLDSTLSTLAQRRLARDTQWVYIKFIDWNVLWCMEPEPWRSGFALTFIFDPLHEVVVYVFWNSIAHFPLYSAKMKSPGDMNLGLCWEQFSYRYYNRYLLPVWQGERESASGKCKIDAIIKPDTTHGEWWLSSIISLRKRCRDLWKSPGDLEQF